MHSYTFLMEDSYQLKRFKDAQAGIYPRVLEELSQGRKTSHWMWFIFPQISGLGRSHTAQKYAISSLHEAQAYLADELLGPRLLKCTQLVNRIEGKNLEQVFSHIDALKFCSSMTLFAIAAPDEFVFQQALDLYCDGHKDPLTLQQLERPSNGR